MRLMITVQSSLWASSACFPINLLRKLTGVSQVTLHNFVFLLSELFFIFLLSFLVGYFFFYLPRVVFSLTRLVPSFSRVPFWTRWAFSVALRTAFVSGVALVSFFRGRVGAASMMLFVLFLVPLRPAALSSSLRRTLRFSRSLQLLFLLWKSAHKPYL